MEKVFKFGSHYLTFARSEEAVMMNATEMAKIYKKNVHDWLRLKSTN
ncbi:MAG TPA: hypothetical protein VEA37_12635 [Flavobacterium sp.]|nr:hypothetical protein [Flavobacterium sp.]